MTARTRAQDHAAPFETQPIPCTTHAEFDTQLYFRVLPKYTDAQPTEIARLFEQAERVLKSQFDSNPDAFAPCRQSMRSDAYGDAKYKPCRTAVLYRYIQDAPKVVSAATFAVLGSADKPQAIMVLFIATHPEHTRRGLGQILVANLMSIALKNEHKWMFTDVAHTDVAQSFWNRSCEFKPCKDSDPLAELRRKYQQQGTTLYGCAELTKVMAKLERKAAGAATSPPVSESKTKKKALSAAAQPAAPSSTTPGTAQPAATSSQARGMTEPPATKVANRWTPPSEPVVSQLQNKLQKSVAQHFAHQVSNGQTPASSSSAASQGQQEHAGGATASKTSRKFGHGLVAAAGTKAAHIVVPDKRPGDPRLKQEQPMKKPKAEESSMNSGLGGAAAAVAPHVHTSSKSSLPGPLARANANTSSSNGAGPAVSALGTAGAIPATGLGVGQSSRQAAAPTATGQVRPAGMPGPTATNTHAAPALPALVDSNGSGNSEVVFIRLACLQMLDKFRISMNELIDKCHQVLSDEKDEDKASTHLEELVKLTKQVERTTASAKAEPKRNELPLLTLFNSSGAAPGASLPAPPPGLPAAALPAPALPAPALPAPPPAPHAPGVDQSIQTDDLQADSSEDFFTVLDDLADRFNKALPVLFGPNDDYNDIVGPLLQSARQAEQRGEMVTAPPGGMPAAPAFRGLQHLLAAEEAEAASQACAGGGAAADEGHVSVEDMDMVIEELSSDRVSGGVPESAGQFNGDAQSNGWQQSLQGSAFAPNLDSGGAAVGQGMASGGDWGRSDQQPQQQQQSEALQPGQPPLALPLHQFMSQVAGSSGQVVLDGGWGQPDAQQQQAQQHQAQQQQQQAQQVVQMAAQMLQQVGSTSAQPGQPPAGNWGFPSAQPGQHQQLGAQMPHLPPPQQPLLPSGMHHPQQPDWRPNGLQPHLPPPQQRQLPPPTAPAQQYFNAQQIRPGWPQPSAQHSHAPPPHMPHMHGQPQQMGHMQLPQHPAGPVKPGPPNALWPPHVRPPWGAQ